MRAPVEEDLCRRNCDHLTWSRSLDYNSLSSRANGCDGSNGYDLGDSQGHSDFDGGIDSPVQLRTGNRSLMP